MSLGDLLSGLSGSLGQLSNQANPNPQAQGGGPGQPGGSQIALDQNATPSVASQSPKDLTAGYLKLYQQERLADQFDRSLAGIAASVAAPGTQSSVYNSLAPSGGGGRSGDMIANLMAIQQGQLKMQQEQTAMREHAAAASGAESAFKALFPDTPDGVGTELFNTGKYADVMANHMASLNPTDEQKKANDASAAFKKGNPNATDQDVANFKANFLSSPETQKMNAVTNAFKLANPTASPQDVAAYTSNYLANPETQKVNMATDAFKGSHPDATQQDIASFKSNYLASPEQQKLSDVGTTYAASHPDATPEQIALVKANSLATPDMQKVNAAVDAFKEGNPKSSKEDIANYKANMLAGMAGGSDLGQRQYLSEKSSGLTTDDYPTWNAKHQAQATAMNEQAKDAQEFKDSATSDYTSVNTKLTDSQAQVDKLLANPTATMAALKSPDFLTTGKVAGNIPGWVPGVGQTQDVKNAAIALNKLRAGLSGDALSSVKNVRNRLEFSTLGQQATGGLDAATDLESLTGSLKTIQNKFLDARATAEMAAGHQLTGPLVGHGNRDLLQKTLPNGSPNPFYNGATEAAPSQGSQGGPTPSATQIQKLKDNPDKAPEFDQMFGDGASKKILGQ